MNGAGRFDPDGSPHAGAASGRGWRPILIAALGLALLLAGAVAYVYADDVIELGSWLMGSHGIHNQGHIRY
jgi:hypothetical protein